MGESSDSLSEPALYDVYRIQPYTTPCPINISRQLSCLYADNGHNLYVEPEKDNREILLRVDAYGRLPLAFILLRHIGGSKIYTSHSANAFLLVYIKESYIITINLNEV